MKDTIGSSDGRIPLALQAVFIAAARGKEIHQAPPNRLAMKTFRRRWGRLSKGATAAQQTTVKQQDQQPSKQKKQTRHHISPQTYLTSLLKNRGYCTEEFCSLETAYYNRPARLQLASYGLYVVDSIRSNDVAAVRACLEAGVSPNACNDFGESLVHMACRLGLPDVLELLVCDYGASVQVADGHGRTPLHDLCWGTQEEPSHAMIDLLLQQDAGLWYIADSDGIVPLDHVLEDHWTGWTKYLMRAKDTFWPDRDIKKVGLQPPPPLAQQPPHSRPLVVVDDSSQHRQRVEEAGLVAHHGPDVLIAKKSKQPSSASAGHQHHDQHHFPSDCSTADETSVGSHSQFLALSPDDLLLHGLDHDDDDDEEEEEEEDDKNFSVSTFDETEMAEILGKLGGGGALAWG